MGAIFNKIGEAIDWAKGGGKKSPASAAPSVDPSAGNKYPSSTPARTPATIPGRGFAKSLPKMGGRLAGMLNTAAMAYEAYKYISDKNKPEDKSREQSKNQNVPADAPTGTTKQESPYADTLPPSATGQKPAEVVKPKIKRQISVPRKERYI